VFLLPQKENPLTVGIGAICEDGKAVVVAADKMVTFGAPMNLQTEPPSLRKIIELTDKVLLVFSGNTADGEQIVSGTKPKITAPNLPVAQIAEAVQQSYSQHKQRKAEDTILKPWLGATFQQFQTLVAQSPSSQILTQVLGAIGQHNLNTDILVAGMDDSGAHLFAVQHPGVLLPLATTGFGAIGSGGLHAGVRMSLSQHTKAATLVDTIYNVYEAKRASEVAPGVGKLTDLALIHNGRITFAGSELMKALEHAHKEKPAPSKAEQDAIKKACDDTIKQPDQSGASNPAPKS
jgi:20S proteasome alpha/beta subunit